MDFGTKYHETQEAIDERKKTLIVRRLMDVQRRSKIKPSSMNPVLLNSASDSSLIGGGYWTDRFNEHAFKTNASPEAIKRVGDELKAAMKDLPPSSWNMGFLDSRKHTLLVNAYAKLREIAQQEQAAAQVPPPSRRAQYMEQRMRELAQQPEQLASELPPFNSKND
jgi:hypothetical protein